MEAGDRRCSGGSGTVCVCTLFSNSEYSIHKSVTAKNGKYKEDMSPTVLWFWTFLLLRKRNCAVIRTFAQIKHNHLAQSKSCHVNSSRSAVTTKYVYIKSTTVFVPSSKLGLSQPLYRQRVCPSPQNRGGGHTRLRERGWGVPIPTTWGKA